MTQREQSTKRTPVRFLYSMTFAKKILRLILVYYYYLPLQKKYTQQDKKAIIIRNIFQQRLNQLVERFCICVFGVAIV